MQLGLRNQTPERHQDFVPYLCMSLPACFTFSLVRLSLPRQSAWGHVATHYTHVYFFQLQSPTETVSESQHHIPEGETLKGRRWGQVTTPGPVSHNQKGSDSIQNSCLVPTPMECLQFSVRAGMAYSLIRQPRDGFYYYYQWIGSGMRDDTFSPRDLDQCRATELVVMTKMF